MNRRTSRRAIEAAAGISKQSARAGQRRSATAPTTVRLRVPADQAARLPRGTHTQQLPAGAPLPRAGEVLSLDNRSTWAVTVVVHEWHTGIGPTVELCLEALDDRPAAGDAARSALH